MPSSLDKLINTFINAVADSGIIDDIADMLNPAPPPRQKRVQAKRKRVVRGRDYTARSRATVAPKPAVRSASLYDLLQVSPTASLNVIQAAYRSLSRLYHPDVPLTGSKTKMQALNSAYEILSDSKKRKEYDARR